MHHRALRLLLLLIPCATAAAARADVPPGWSPALADAFAAYDEGRFTQALAEARTLVSAPDDRLSLDAEALASMATIRGESRTEWVDGRGRLTRLIFGAPQLGERPDLRLALGLGHLALNESAAALDNLALAEDGFARQERPAARLEALAAQAEAWAIHNEWSMTPAQFNEPVPAGIPAANAVRERRIRDLRAVAETLPASEQTLAKIDVALGTLLLGAGDRRDEALALLRPVAALAPVDRTVARANLLLADDLAATGAIEAAAEHYERVARAPVGDLTVAAERGLRALREPRFEIDIPQRVRAEHAAGVVIRAANVAAAAVEIRRVDFPAWLESQRGQFSESLLPEEGAVAANGALPPGAGERERALRIDDALSAGSYVIIARGRDAAGREVVSKRLLVVDSLDAAVFTGRDAGLLLVGGSGEAEARFWMHGALSPIVLAVRGGVAAFPLPPESRLLRDRRWTCVVRRGETLAVCRGVIPGGVERAGLPPGVLLSLSPAAPRVGEEIVIAGAVPLAARPDRRSAATSLEIALVDPAERVVAESRAPVDERGFFFTRIRATPEMAGKTIQAIVRASGQTLDQLYRRAGVAVEPLDDPTVRAVVQMPPHLARLLGPVPLRLRTEWIGGGPVGGQPIELVTNASRWPTESQPQFAARPVSRREKMPVEGRRDLATNVGALGLPEGPKSVLLRLTSFNPDRRPAVAEAPVMIAPQPLHAWVEVDAERPIVGMPTHLSLGWFDAAGVVAGPPRVEIAGPDGRRRELAIYESAAGLRTAEWIPAIPGRHRATLTFDGVSDSAGTFAREITVGAPADRPVESLVSLRAVRQGGSDSVRVTASSESPQSLFVIAAGLDPLGGARVDVGPADGEASIDLAAPAPAGRPIRVYAVRFDDGRPRIVAGCDVELAPEPALTLTETSSETILGGVKNFKVSLDGADLRGATVVSRLMPIEPPGRHLWTPPETSPDRSGGVPRLRVDGASFAGGPGDGGPVLTPAAAEPFDSATVLHLAASAAIWADAALAGGEVTVSPAIPSRQGRFRLEVIAARADGSLARGAHLIDTRRSAELTLEFPPSVEVGDRMFGLVRIDHRGDSPLATSLAFKPPAGLRIIRALDASGRALADADGAFTVAIEPRSATRIAVEFEVAAPLRGTLRVELTTPDGRVPAATVIRTPVDAAAAGPSPTEERIRVQRRLYRLERPIEWAQIEDDASEPQSEVDRMPEYNRIPLSADLPVPAGTPILVEETIAFPRFAGTLDWQQRIPANCVTLADAPRDFAVVGKLEQRRVGSLHYSAPLADTAERVHSYIIVPTRAGVCRFPAPTVRSGRTRVPVELSPSDETIATVQ
ncbi:MAG: hypothetical protein AMXMBFR47_37030 [Planctomycetota bacterium]